MNTVFPWTNDTIAKFYTGIVDSQGRVIGAPTPQIAWERYCKTIEAVGNTSICSRIEPRTRNEDYKKALSFEVFDPLWMLCRQWQYGRFKAADCGSPVMVKIKTVKKNIDKVLRGDGEDIRYSTDVPLECEVEKQNVEITPYVCVESAMQFKKMIANVKQKKSVVESLLKEYPLDCSPEDDLSSLELLKNKKNTALNKFIKFYASRSFDGSKLYDAILNGTVESSIQKSVGTKILENYKEWFKNKFLPCTDKKGTESKDCWNISKLGYETEVRQQNNRYVAEDYDSGKLSWYSFDKKGADDLSYKDEEVKMLSYIPTPAKIPGAPASRLWEFEDRQVNMGNNSNDFNSIATVAIMQYITMFSNDWMITPLETETGTILDVDGIVVRDSFGDRFYINKNAQQFDKSEYDRKYGSGAYDKLVYTDRWDMFGNSYVEAYANEKFSTSRGLFFPPTVLRCEESKPIEEVQFLRDEMANMVWGVETTLNNKCGGTMDGKSLSDSVLSEVDEVNLTKAGEHDPITSDEDAEYSLLIQNRVPMNWIPFLPEQVIGNCREIAFRRATMPIFYNDGREEVYKKVRPSTSLLAVKKEKKGEKDCVVPLYINEEELATCGIKVRKTAQRTRWFFGKSFNWIGNREIISEYQANSGLMFDELISKVTGKAITLKPSETPEEQSVAEEPPAEQ